MAREQGGMHMTKMGNFQQWGWEYFVKRPSDAGSSSGTIARTYCTSGCNLWTFSADQHLIGLVQFKNIHSSVAECDVLDSMATSNFLSGDCKTGNKTPPFLA